MKRKMKTNGIVKTVLGGAAGGAIVQVVKGALLKNSDPLYTDLGAIAVGAFAPSFVKMDGIGEMGAGMIGAGVASIIASKVPSLNNSGSSVSGWRNFNGALYGTKQAGYRQQIITGAKAQKKNLSTLG